MNMNVNTKQAFESAEMAEMMVEKMMSSFSVELKTLFKATVAKKMIEETLKKASEKAIEEIRKVVREAVVEEAPVKIAKPQSAKAFFDKENREQAKKELIEKGTAKPKVADVNKHLSEMWKKLDDDQKKPFQKAFEDAKKMYKAVHPEEEKKEAKPKKMTAKALYVSEIMQTSSDEMTEEKALKMWEDLEDKKKKVYREKAKAEKENAMSDQEKELAKKKKDPNAPKRRNAYQIFCAEKKAEKMSIDAIRTAWSGLSDDKKKPYQEMAKAEKDEYEEKIKNFVASDSDSESESKKKKSTRPLSARLRFFADEEQQKNYPADTKKEMTKLMNDAWKEMTEKEKLPYEEEAKKELAEWKKANSDSESGSDSEAEKPKKKAVKKVAKKEVAKIEVISDDEESEDEKPKKKTVAKKVAKKVAKSDDEDSDSDSDLEDL